MTQSNGIVEGASFSHNYARPDQPLPDSMRFRVRLGQKLVDWVDEYHRDLRSYLAREGGIVVSGIYAGDFSSWLKKAEIKEVLDAVTIIWRYFNWRSLRRAGGFEDYGTWAIYRDNWKAFVSRVFSEESMGYRVDEKCGIHYLVDSDFEGARSAALRGLGLPRYAGVRDAYEKAHAYLDENPADTKAAVRSAFEALEILTRLMVPEAQNLNKRMISERLKPLALRETVDDAHRAVVDGIFEGLAQFVNGVHYYRHGQGQEAVVKPPMEIAVYVLSSVSAAIRLLLVVDQRVLPSV